MRHRTYKFFRGLGFIGISLYNFTLFYDLIVSILHEGFPEALPLSVPIWVGLTLWVSHYAWCCLTEWVWLEYGVLLGIRCCLEWLFSMIGNFVWPLALAVFLHYYLYQHSNLPTWILFITPKAVGVLCLGFNFMYPRRQIEKIFQGVYWTD